MHLLVVEDDPRLGRLLTRLLTEERHLVELIGEYSGVSGGAGQSDTSQARWLRGYQVTDANGMATFTTIYPGWYSGRAVHIHFKIRTNPASNAGTEFTSQLFSTTSSAPRSSRAVSRTPRRAPTTSRTTATTSSPRRTAS
jgi:protocatechuate 3,4-dioxygenase beta subunit